MNRQHNIVNLHIIYRAPNNEMPTRVCQFETKHTSVSLPDHRMAFKMEIKTGLTAVRLTKHTQIVVQICITLDLSHVIVTYSSKWNAHPQHIWQRRSTAITKQASLWLDTSFLYERSTIHERLMTWCRTDWQLSSQLRHQSAAAAAFLRKMP